MGKVSGKTHTKKQLDNYANQHNPNNKAYRANANNHANQLNPNNKAYRANAEQDIKSYYWGRLAKTEQNSADNYPFFARLAKTDR